MTETIIAVDNKGDEHITEQGNGRQYCKQRKINLDWSKTKSLEGIVIAGGIFFSCTECGNTGAIVASEFTLDLKHKMGLHKHEPIGMEFYFCDQHEGENLDE